MVGTNTPSGYLTVCYGSHGSFTDGKHDDLPMGYRMNCY